MITNILELNLHNYISYGYNMMYSFTIINALVSMYHVFYLSNILQICVNVTFRLNTIIKKIGLVLAGVSEVVL